MLIHFICTGNTYRSRMAEVYLKSKQLKGIKVISSGINATNNLNGPIAWFAARIILNENLISYMSSIWQQTIKELIDKSDLVIFMEKMHYNFCVRHFGYNSKNYKIWNISDVKMLLGVTKGEMLQEDIELMKIADKTYQKIKKKIDDLVVRLKLQE